MSRARAGAAALRRETGVAAVEYAGVLLLVGLIFVGLFQIGLPGEVAKWAGKVVAVIDANDTGGGTTGSPQGTSGNAQGTSGNAQGTSGSGQGTSGSGQGTSGSGQGTSGNGQGTNGNAQGTNGNAQGTNGNAQGTNGNGQGTSGKGSGGDDGSHIPCTEAADAGLCMTALGAPNALEEKVQERARNAVKTAAENLANSDDVPPGSPEHEKLVNKLNRAVDQLRESRKITENPLIRATSPIRKYANPRYKDLQEHANRLSKVLPFLKNKNEPAVPTAPAADVPSSRATAAANKLLRGMGKFGKGLGIAGTAISGYDNIRKDGWAKGATETLGGAAFAYGGSAAVMAGCGMVAIATAGVGGLVCAGGAIVVGAVVGKYGKQITGWAYDHAGEAWNFTKDKVSEGAKAAAHNAVEGGKKIVGGAGKVISSLKPGFL
jgi:hypothetical protein